ncbi:MULTISPECIES: DUF5816 domain-containing protein [Natrialba]|uniref:GNAT family acetyltransferase n=1 Tax=Natrialba swarupiae TaxID=2448032 RepID=A0A5D5AGP7_9EURY|nr:MULTISPECIES: DUF5816 domain-containing protein [Natrialba]MWV41174.1 GNAT family acetyltransferase [Natrialba sp. INN-245]TYT60886.1 GNAT family acetyltransferase [Natrialba swarupiae]
MQPTVTEGGKTVYVSNTDGDRGSKGPFLVAYESQDGVSRYGWFCSNCESFDNAMDAMGRIKCNSCGNFRKPTEWDAAHE